MATAAVRRPAEDRADSTNAHRPLIEDCRKVVLRGAREHVSAIHQRESSSMAMAPGGLHLGSVKCAVRLTTQAAVPDRYAKTVVALVGVELVHVPYLAERPPHVLHDLHLFERSSQRVGCGADGIHDGMPRSLRGRPCFLARRARRLGCHPCLLAGYARGFSGFSQPFSLLSDCFERFAMMITDLTGFFGELPELFRLATGSLRGRAVFR